MIYLIISIVLLVFLQSLGLEASPGFRPVLISSQPNPARQPLSEFFLQLGPERYFLLHLNNGQIVTLRDFSPVCYTLSVVFCLFLLSLLSGFLKANSTTLVTYSICHPNVFINRPCWFHSPLLEKKLLLLSCLPRTKP